MTDQTSREQIQEILRARRARADQLRAEQQILESIPAMPATVQAQSIPVAPQNTPAPAPGPAQEGQHEPPRAETPAAPAAPPAASQAPQRPLTPEDIDRMGAEILTEHLPALQATVAPFVVDIRELFTPPFSWREVPRALVSARNLGEEIATVVSAFVSDYLPSFKGLDAQAMVDVLIAWLLGKTLRPHVPQWAYGMLLPMILGAVKAVYETRVRPRIQAKAPRIP